MDLEKNENVGFLKRVILSIQYAFESLKDWRRYPYALSGELPQNDEGKTILIYRIRGKRDIYQMPAQEICNHPGLISKFHPLDVRIIAYISGVEQILDVKKSERKSIFNSMKEQIFDKI